MFIEELCAGLTALLTVLCTSDKGATQRVPARFQENSELESTPLIPANQHAELNLSYSKSQKLTYVKPCWSELR